MKKIIRFAALLAAAFLTAGCSLLESDSSGSVTFRIDGATAEILRHAQNDKSRHAELVSASRSLTAEDVSTGSTTEGLYFDIALKGDYTAKQTLPVTEGATAVFDDIPVGARVYAEATAYKIENDEKQILYTGKSDEITVREGKNTLSLAMKKVTAVKVSVTITVEESSDISVKIDKDETNIDKGIIIYTFTADEGYESYTWKLDGEETYTSENIFTFNTRGATAGTYDISLIAKKLVVEATEESSAQYEYYSYEAHITVE